MTARRALARVNLAAIARTCARLRPELRRGAALCAVVKADGYGHGAVQSARAALAGGASWLAVAGAREAHELRDAGLRDVRILVMGALSPDELEEALAADADVVVWSERYLHAVIAAGGGRVHVKLDTGMGRLGTRDPAEASRVALAALKEPQVRLAGLMTHFATADDLKDDGFFAGQLETFAHWVRTVKAEHPEVVVHAANSAAMLRDAEAQFDMVRCGIAIYGMDPFGRDPAARGLEPALELSSYVAEVKPCREGESTGYGRRFVAEQDTYLGVLPIGYGDGWRRGLFHNTDVPGGGETLPAGGNGEHGQHHDRPRARRARAAAARGASDPDRLPGQRADHRRGGCAASRHDQLRGHVRAHAARPARLSPRRRGRAQGRGQRARADRQPRHGVSTGGA